MSGLNKFKSIPAHHRALVAVAVLLDGREAASYLQSDPGHGMKLAETARDLAALSPELRMPLLGSLLRSALAELRIQVTRI